MHKILQLFASNATLQKESWCLGVLKVFEILSKMIPKVLQTYNTLENTILHYALYLQSFKKYATIVSTKNLFLPYSLFKKNLNLQQTRKKHKKFV